MGPGWVWSAVVAGAVGAASLGLTGWLRRWLADRAILDRPVERSSHRVPVPRGGGLAVMAALGTGWLVLAWRGAPTGTLTVLCVAACLAILSWRDDLGGLPVAARLAAHGAAVLLGLTALGGLVFQGLLPPLADHAIAALLWLWFVELFNFMDGIDGIAGVETAAIGIGTVAVLAVAPVIDDGSAALALAAAAAALGFLRWNWHPAQIFLGDVGSVPLGYLLGWLLLLLAGKGLWAPALILPLYYLADASITLVRRAARRAPVWQAHREHFYQRALLRDGDHGAVARLVLAADGALVLLAVLALRQPLAALTLAAVVVAVLLRVLQRRAQR